MLKLTLILLFSAGIPVTSGQDNTVWIKEATQKYSPASWQLLSLYDAIPENLEAATSMGGKVTTKKGTGTFYYLEGSSKKELLLSMASNVHEIAHGYFSQNVFMYVNENSLWFDWEKVLGYAWLNDEESYFIAFPKKSLFPSVELARVIPREQRTFRFDEYIRGVTSTQGEGVIGLLDELLAYYHGSRFCYDMIGAFREVEGNDADALFQWVSRSQSTMTAFWEFDFFINEYLLYMLSRYPDNYRDLADCKPFVDAYRAVRSAYEDLVRQYEERLRTEMQRLNSSGKAEAIIEGGVMWISPPGGMHRRGTPVFSEAMDILKPVLDSERYSSVRTDFPIK